MSSIFNSGQGAYCNPAFKAGPASFFNSSLSPLKKTEFSSEQKETQMPQKMAQGAQEDIDKHHLDFINQLLDADDVKLTDKEVTS